MNPEPNAPLAVATGSAVWWSDGWCRLLKNTMRQVGGFEQVSRRILTRVEIALHRELDMWRRLPPNALTSATEANHE